MSHEEYFHARNKMIESAVERNANKRQVGGGHYGHGLVTIQHWDLMAVNNAGYFPGQITKYISRWREKNGIQDLEKAEHYLQKMMELLRDEVLKFPPKREAELLGYFRSEHRLNSVENRILELLLTYTAFPELSEAASLIRRLIFEAQGK